MKTVWKYSLEVTDNIELKLPTGAEFLSVQTQHEKPEAWFLVDTATDGNEVRNFRIAGTGHPIEEDVEYLGTFQMFGGTLVFHLFEVA